MKQSQTKWLSLCAISFSLVYSAVPQCGSKERKCESKYSMWFNNKITSQKCRTYYEEADGAYYECELNPVSPPNPGRDWRYAQRICRRSERECKKSTCPCVIM